MDQQLPVVAFLGPKASYTHQATSQHFPQTHHDLRPQTSIEDVFSAVQSGRAAAGVVPFENSSNGAVVFTLDLLADPAARHPDIRVVAEIYLPVHHCLVGRAAAATTTGTSPSKDAHAPHPSKTDRPWRKLRDEQQPAPALRAVNADLRHITKLYTHPQAWGQCRRFLGTHFPSAERVDVSSTSKAAERVASEEAAAPSPNGISEAAAISSRLAAELNGLDVLAEGIEDDEGNCTRFFVLRKAAVGKDVAATNATTAVVDGAQQQRRSAGQIKTLVAFTVDHGEAGALADSLAVFKKFALNLSSINTRPSGAAAWHYVFFVEVRGGEGGAVEQALKELGRVAKSSRWLGSWESMSEEGKE